MRPHLRSVSNNSGLSGEPPGGDSGSGPEPDEALPRRPESNLSATHHLGRCSQCGALNGQSAETCWSCESELLIALPLGQVGAGDVALLHPGRTLAGAAQRREAWHEPDRDRPDAPPESPVEPTATEAPPRQAQPAPQEMHDAEDDTEPAVPPLNIAAGATGPVSSFGSVIGTARAPRPRWHVQAYVGAIALLIVGGAYWIGTGLTTDARDSVLNSTALLRSQGVVSEPEVAAPAPVAVAAPAPLAPVAAAAPTVPSVAPPSRTSIAEVDVSPAAPVRAKAVASERARVATRSAPRAVAEPLALLASPPVRAAAPAPRDARTSLGPCTPNVAALGLCTAASIPPQE